MFDDDYEEDDILNEMRNEKVSFRTILNKKKLTRWELDEAFGGEI